MFFVRRFWAKQFCDLVFHFSIVSCLEPSDLLFWNQHEVLLICNSNSFWIQHFLKRFVDEMDDDGWYLHFYHIQFTEKSIESLSVRNNMAPVHPESTASTSCAEPQKESDCPRNPHHIHRGSMSPWVSTIPCWPSTRQSSHGHLNLAHHWHSGLEV